MATTRKQGTAAKKAALADSFELTLTDFRIVNLKCERFLAPESAPRGAFELEASSDTVKIPTKKQKDAATPPVVISYNVKVVGTKASEGKERRHSNERSFSIDLSVEGFFQLSGKDNLDPKDLSNERCMFVALQQLHVLSVDRIRTLAAELGYKGVRPALGSTAYELRQEVRKLS